MVTIYILYSHCKDDAEVSVIMATTDINQMLATCKECMLDIDYEEIFGEELTLDGIQRQEFIDFGYDDDDVRCVLEKHYVRIPQNK